MNKLRKFQVIVTIVMFVLITAFLLSTQGCKGTSSETAMARVTRLLQSTTWKLSKSTVDGTDQTSLFKDMSLTVSAGTYTTTGGAPVWPSAGVWKLTDETTAVRDNDVMIKIDHIDEETLKLSLQWASTTFGNGRNSSIKGSHVFELKRAN